jgi:hypothetical protein
MRTTDITTVERWGSKVMISTVHKKKNTRLKAAGDRRYGKYDLSQKLMKTKQQHKTIIYALGFNVDSP